ncbi:ArsR/SmtB family transcription factor [Photobacterium galatheae]|uniref:ArsR family transcriptional regulator n=1 Tax=Photobacterium galatheae TaxID=1654360 RepID=A0A066RHP2_9GAMM|nr:metalloregulator ArsR/SmtB family transcription factor [Photobacterium galatheae]KDM89834.1 ArsR family transcriptional regulator [Photobacterium galatheae]MCM0151131.1 metalloregulator ArsR/SmtB family transcription factor [Photobacterium galatheae]
MSMINNQYHIYSELADLARPLGNAHRLILLEHIAQGEKPVEKLAELAELTVANASQHLQQLKRNGYVQTRREGKHVFYRLGDAPIVELLIALRQFAEFNHSEIKKLVVSTLNDQKDAEAISREELLSRMHENSVTLLDVRPEEEFAQGHLPGAVNIPLTELEKRLSELPEEQDIVAYCRGPYCSLSVKAVIALREKGLSARRFNEGVPEWKAAGYPVNRS